MVELGWLVFPDDPHFSRGGGGGVVYRKPSWINRQIYRRNFVADHISTTRKLKLKSRSNEASILLFFFNSSESSSSFLSSFFGLSERSVGDLSFSGGIIVEGKIAGEFCKKLIHHLRLIISALNSRGIRLESFSRERPREEETKRGGKRSGGRREEARINCSYHPPSPPTPLSNLQLKSSATNFNLIVRRSRRPFYTSPSAHLLSSPLSSLSRFCSLEKGVKASPV